MFLFLAVMEFNEVHLLDLFAWVQIERTSVECFHFIQLILVLYYICLTALVTSYHHSCPVKTTCLQFLEFFEC